MKDLVLAIIKKENTIWKHVYKNTWVSGSVTEVYPITLWNDYVSIQIDTKRSVFNKAIKRVVDEYPYIFANGMFCKNDDSCPAEIRFYYTDTFKDVLMNGIETNKGWFVIADNGTEKIARAFADKDFSYTFSREMTREDIIKEINELD